MRALDLVANQSLNDSKSDIYSNYARQMQDILRQQAGLENQQDAYVMQGEQSRDLADRQDRDAFFTNLGEGLTGVAKGISQTGKDLNTQIGNQDILDILSDLSKNGISYVRDKNGRLKQKKVK